MTFPVNKLLKFTEYIKGKLIAASVSYLFAKMVSVIEESSGWNELWDQKFYLFDMTLPSNILLWTGIGASIIIYALNLVLKAVVQAQNPSEKFRKIMKLHTAKEIEQVSQGTYSWGYNYCVHFSRDPRGWKPEVFFIGEYDENDDSLCWIPKYEKENLPGYCQDSFQKYSIENEKVKAVLEKKENRDRYAACHVISNLNYDNPRVDVKLKKTSWVHLQYNWDYFRLLDEKTNRAIDNKPNANKVQNALYEAYRNQGNAFYMNSFCLHLIIETKKGVILSRISQTKKNDYASTWAATIGEQIELKDFYDNDNNERYYREDFVECWTKRALKEEFGIITEEDYEAVVEPKSLRVLSVDMEADIYNVALTCVVRFKMSLEEFLAGHRGKIDRLENFELKECSVKEIPGILMNYPENQSEYHPSTYLRLLMFHRYKVGTNETHELFCKASKNKRLKD